MEKVLVVGGGGREHALAWKLAQSDRINTVFVAPGNAGTAHENGVENIAIAADDTDRLCEFAQLEGINLTVIGPEGPLVEGIVDRFTEKGLRCLGPSGKAAQLEGSKSFAKDFLQRHNIPTAEHQVFSESKKAYAWLESNEPPFVIKADGLAAGKGVIITHELKEAKQAITQILEEQRFGDAGNQVVIEQFLSGEEVSYICLVSGKEVLPLATSQDHKARDNGDQGPNTGGMGAYSPAPIVDPSLDQRILKQVIEPTVNGLASEGIPYTGFLYAGLMIGEDNVPRVLEFNCRLGDPETQPILMRLNSDLATLCDAVLDGHIADIDVVWDKRCSLGVVMASAGYPDCYDIGLPIDGLDTPEEDTVKVFHAGTHDRDGQVLTSGGRVLCVTALGSDIESARDLVYSTIKSIHWPGSFWRADIGHRALARQETEHK